MLTEYAKKLSCASQGMDALFTCALEISVGLCSLVVCRAPFRGHVCTLEHFGGLCEGRQGPLFFTCRVLFPVCCLLDIWRASGAVDYLAGKRRSVDG